MCQRPHLFLDGVPWLHSSNVLTGFRPSDIKVAAFTHDKHPSVGNIRCLLCICTARQYCNYIRDNVFGNAGLFVGVV